MILCLSQIQVVDAAAAQPFEEAVVHVWQPLAVGARGVDRVWLIVLQQQHAAQIERLGENSAQTVNLCQCRGTSAM